VSDIIYSGGKQTLRWRGYVIWKNPIDLFMYAEIVHEVRPTLVIEAGTFAGGSALFWLDMLQLNNIDGRVLSTDVQPQENMPEDEGITFMEISSTSEEFLYEATRLAWKQKVLINLDSNHDYENVSRELELLSSLVSRGSYLIVEDGIDDTRYNRKAALAASRDFLSGHPEFRADRTRERLGLTNCPEGYLLRI
jgi:cephalosporin hydroxylase